MEFLQQLQIEKNNWGVSTGTKWIKTGRSTMESFSPVDGKLIGTVATADESSYQQIINQAKKAFIE